MTRPDDPSQQSDPEPTGVADPKEAAELAGLVYVQDDQAGITR